MMDTPKGWTEATIGDLCELKNGRAFKSSEWSNRGRKIVRIQNLNNTDAPYNHFEGEVPGRFVIDTNDLLFAWSGTPGISFGAHIWRGGEALLNQHIFRVDFDYNLLELKYLKYAINNTLDEQVEKAHGGIGLRHITKKKFEQTRILVPPLAEQRRIVEKIEPLFDEIDKGIESLQTAKATLGLYRQSLLKAAFEGRLTANWREQNANKLEDPETLINSIQAEREARYKATLDDWEKTVARWRASGQESKKPRKPRRPAWPTEFDFSSLAELPDGWTYVPFEALAWSIRNGISTKPDEIGPLKIFRISAVRPMNFDLEDFRRITDSDGQFDSYRLEYGDLVFTRYNGSRDYVGVSAMYRGDGSHVYPDKLICCEIKSDFLDPEFVEAATNCGESHLYIKQHIRTTAGQSGISGADIKKMPVPLCSRAEQAEIVSQLATRLEAAGTVEAEIDAALRRADALRQSVLKKAFSGQLVEQDLSDEPAATLLDN